MANLKSDIAQAQANLASKNDIADIVTKTDLDSKLISFNKRINSKKTKHVFVEN